MALKKKCTLFVYKIMEFVSALLNEFNILLVSILLHYGEWKNYTNVQILKTLSWIVSKTQDRTFSEYSPFIDKAIDCVKHLKIF